MDPVLLAQLRRQWPIGTALVVFLLFLALHAVAFQPALQRYQRVVKQAADMGVAADPDQAPRMMPARVFALLSDNSMPAATADQQSGSGELTSTLLEDVTRVASKNGMRVIATEPGATARLPRAVQVRAHVRVTCSYGEFVAFLDDLSRSGKLISVDRFSMVSVSPGRQTLDLWLTRYVIKQTAAPR
jgi:type II secretion system (T2SS) protein M